ncbi:CLUMA_CG000382, isoform A [Clunio marinus]|uniref:CLUMA_CG000382, isoform A n=1 Tax=Clunio marinus TaxID=568069 RepID=A0A1J1HF06_9DIPT|nr:CLUMA_CG000382, isoform A [Clunio marinus]
MWVHMTLEEGGDVLKELSSMILLSIEDVESHERDRLDQVKDNVMKIGGYLYQPIPFHLRLLADIRFESCEKRADSMISTGFCKTLSKS